MSVALCRSPSLRRDFRASSEALPGPSSIKVSRAMSESVYRIKETWRYLTIKLPFEYLNVNATVKRLQQYLGAPIYRVECPVYFALLDNKFRV